MRGTALLASTPTLVQCLTSRVLFLSLLLATATPSVEVLVLLPEAADVDAEGRAAARLTAAMDSG
jgi:hypothetical protein